MLTLFPIILIVALFGVKGGNYLYKIGKLWSRTWYFFVFIKHEEIYECEHNTNLQYIFVANHVSYLDIPPVILGIHQPMRVLGKYEMAKIPIFGTIYKAMAIQVNRSNAEHRARSVRALKAALSQKLSIMLFPEGTFNMNDKEPLKEFYDGAFRIAIETQTPIQPILLIDTLERLHWKSIFSLTPGKNRVVYLQHITVETLTAKDIPLLKSTVYNKMDEALRKYRKY